MRRTRWLFPPAILIILAFIGVTYYKRKALLLKDAPVAPKSLAAGVDVSAQYWTYSEGSATQKRFSIRAKSFRQIKEPSVVELEDVELQLFHKQGTTFDLVHSA